MILGVLAISVGCGSDSTPDGQGTETGGPATVMSTTSTTATSETTAADETSAPSDSSGPPLIADVWSLDMGVPEPPSLVATPPGGTFVGTVEVALDVPDRNAEIWYTLDGSSPLVGDSIEYTGPIKISESTGLRAVAQLDDDVQLAIAPSFIRIEPELDGFSSELPLMIMWTRDLAPVKKSDLYTDFTLSLFDRAAGGVTTWPADASLSVRSGLRVRGSSSSSFPKKPYRIETWDPASPLDSDMDVEPLGLPPEADWILIAPLIFDRAFMRNALIYNLSNQIDRYASRTRFVELFVAEVGEPVGMDDHVGIYVLAERIERDVSRLPLTALEPEDVAKPAVTGAYIFKEDRTGPRENGFQAGQAGGAFDFQQPFVLVDPDEDEIQPQQLTYLQDLLDEFGDALASPGFTHPVTGRHYSEIIDVDAFIDHHILNVYSKNPDSFRLSGFFHKDRDGLIHAGPAWDFDRTMGCASDPRASDPTWWDASNETNDCTFVFEHGFWLGLFSDPLFADQYWNRWAELLASDLSVASVHATVDAMEAELSESAPRNYARWPGYPPRGGSLASEVDILKDWLAERHAWMSGCLALPDPQSCVGD